MAKTIRVAAAGDIHAGTGDADRVAEAFRRAAGQADLILLAGDLTQHGQVDEVCVVADACRDLDIPVVAVLGNHDWQSDRASDLVRALAGAGVVVLDRAHTILPVAGVSVGIAGAKGFVGGFGNQWANFGEPLFR
jgi:predicted MPP superfamily phosphohydrolase